MFTGPLKETTQAFVFVFCTNLIGGSIGCLWMQYLTTLPRLHMEGYSPSDFLVYPTRTDLSMQKALGPTAQDELVSSISFDLCSS